MSRGGFGGRGRGGGGRGGFGGIFGDPDLKPDYSVTELFPPQSVPLQSALKKEERVIVARYRRHREKIHTGPMYTVMGKGRGAVNPFNDIKRYSQKYKREARRVPKLDARPYVHEFFPAELYSTLGVDADSEAAKKKTFHLSALDSLDTMDDLLEGGGSEGEDGEDTAASRLRRAVGGEMGIDNDDEPGEDEDEEPDELDDDSEGDYNAEEYFDNDDIGMDDDDGGDYEGEL